MAEKLHIAMFPWLAFGHLIPFLEVARLIAQKGHKISFISTPRNIDRLPKVSSTLAPSIRFVKLPLPPQENLPQDAENTIDLPYDKVLYLKLAYDGLQEPLAKLLEALSPDWLICDFAAYWLPSLARSLGIPSAYFSIFIAPSLALFKPTSPLIENIEDDRQKPEDYTVPPKWVPFPSKIAFRLFEILRIADSFTGIDSHISDADRFEQVLRDVDVISLRGCWEIVPEYIHLLEKFHNKPVIPVGQLPPIPYEGGDDDETWISIKKWLDQQQKGSVLYVAFGSEAKPSHQELNEIALGLELSGLPFFWVLRTRRGSGDTESTQLPEGFEERTKGRGIVWANWAPQLKILRHDSVGGCLTHGGWGSVVEALQFERPVILLTFLAEQGLNARVLEERQMAYLIPRNDHDGWFTRDAVAESLKLVMVKEEGKVYREKAKEVKGLFGDRNKQDHYMDKFLDCLINHSRRSPRTARD